MLAGLFFSQCTTSERVLDRCVTIPQADYREGPLGLLLRIMSEQVNDGQESDEASAGCGQQGWARRWDPVAKDLERLPVLWDFILYAEGGEGDLMRNRAENEWRTAG